MTSGERWRGKFPSLASHEVLHMLRMIPSTVGCLTPNPSLPLIPADSEHYMVSQLPEQGRQLLTSPHGDELI